MIFSLIPQFYLSIFSFYYSPGQQVLLIGLLDGSIWIRSCSTMNLLVVIESSIAYNQAAWKIEPLGQSCFASATDDGQLIVWKIEKPIVENPPSS